MTKRFNNLKHPRPHPSTPSQRAWLGVLVAVIGIMLALAFCSRSHASDCGGLYALAQEHSDDMARRNSLDHSGFFGPHGRGARGARAENVAYGYRTEEQTLAQWRRSKPHARNMELGGCQVVAHACNARRCYWTLEVGW